MQRKMLSRDDCTRRVCVCVCMCDSISLLSFYSSKSRALGGRNLETTQVDELTRRLQRLLSFWRRQSIRVRARITKRASERASERPVAQTIGDLLRVSCVAQTATFVRFQLELESARMQRQKS